jgi:aspartate kinase
VIVCKFGGSSVDGAAGIERVAGILRARLARRPVVVVSAMAKTTRRLLDSGEAAAAGNLAAALASCEELCDFHRREGEAAVPAASHPTLAAALDRSFNELRTLLVRLARERRLAPRDADAVAAFGEVLASEILALALPGFGVEAAWIDARRVMVTDGAFTRAQPLYEETGIRLRTALLPLVERGALPVVGGYIGATRDGVVTTLGKEGSDFSAAIVGAALSAAEIQIWTDVDGILTADPRLVPGARRVSALSFAESLELACSGAKKPHPGTLGPASRAGVPIRILNSLDDRGGQRGDRGDRSQDGSPSQAVDRGHRSHRGHRGDRSQGGGLADDAEGAAGTLIGGRGPAPGVPAVKSLACRPNDYLLHVGAGPAAGERFAAQIVEAVERLRPVLLVLRLGSDGADLALDRADRLAEAREALAAAGEIGVLRGRAVVSLVSDDLAGANGLAARVLAAAAEYQPLLVVAGAAAPAVRCLVELEDLPSAVAALHRRLFGEPREPTAEGAAGNAAAPRADARV